MRTLPITDGRLPTEPCTEDTVLVGRVVCTEAELQRFANGHRVQIRDPSVQLRGDERLTTVVRPLRR